MKQDRLKVQEALRWINKNPEYKKIWSGDTYTPRSKRVKRATHEASEIFGVNAEHLAYILTGFFKVYQN